MDFLVGMAVILLIAIFYWYGRPEKFPPGPRGLPIVGVLPFLGKYPERTMKKWSEKYGPIMSVRMGSKDMVVLNDYDVVQQAFVKQSSQFSGRPYSPFIEQLNQGHGLAFLDYGKRWKEQRNFGLTTFREFGLGQHMMESKILDEISYLSQAIKDQKEKPFNIMFLIQSAVSNLICKIVLGKRFNYNDPEFKTMRQFVKNHEDPVINSMVSLFQMAPILMKIPPFSGYNTKIVFDIKTAEKMFIDIITKHKETLDEEDVRDFIDAFLVEANRNSSETFTVKQLSSYILDMFFAGTESTTNTLYWSLLCLLHYPQIQSRLRKEIMDTIGSDGSVTTKFRSEMPFTCAFIEEIMRFRTVSPLGLLHATTENATVGGFVIPKGTMVAGNIWAVHNDKKYWEQPELFNPDRFLNEKGKFVKSSHVIPFSSGPRQCVGQSLAQMEIFLFLVSLVRDFEILPDPEAEILSGIEEGCNGFVFKANPYKLVAKAL